MNNSNIKNKNKSDVPANRSGHISNVLRSLSGVVPVSKIKAGRLELLVNNWHNIAGEVLSQRSVPGFIKKDTLQIILDSKSTLMAVKGIENKLLEDISGFQGMSGIKNIEFSVNQSLFRKKTSNKSDFDSGKLDYNSSLQNMAESSFGDNRGSNCSECGEIDKIKEFQDLLKIDSDLAAAFKAFSVSSRLREKNLKEKGAKQCEGVLQSGAQCQNMVFNSSLCPSCRSLKLIEVENSLEELLFETPWVGLERLKKDMKAIDDVIYMRARSRVEKRLYNELSEVAEKYKFNSSSGNYRQLKTCADKIVMFRMGISPEKLSTKFYPSVIDGYILRLLRP